MNTEDLNSAYNLGMTCQNNMKSEPVIFSLEELTWPLMIADSVR